MAIIGIDLGTTNSCVAVKNLVATDTQKIIVLNDEVGRNTVPSVVAEMGGDTVLIGHSAKQMMMQDVSYNIHSFVKRSMGTDKKFSLNGKECLPEEISAEILKYIKKLAEKSLNTKIDRAVITVPAYFNNTQKLATKKAAELAGFDLQLEDILMEPVAAGLAYFYEERSPCMKILCYDLGGGTFDVTVMEKKEDAIELKGKSFGGDQYLGGYDFDKMLVGYFIEKLSKKGYDIGVSEENDKERINYNKLLYVAEKTKIKLSDELEYMVVERELLTDRQGKVVDLVMPVSRDKFNSLIAEKIEETIDETLRVIKDSGLTPQQIDKVIMVGGSSRIPYIKESLEKAIGKVPELIDPDTCVAIGAAIKASSLVGMITEGIKLDPFSEVTGDEEITISGQVDIKKERFKGTTSVKIERGDRGYNNETKVTDIGSFFFEGVSLAEDIVNQFEVSLYDDKGDLLIKHNLAITHKSDIDEEEGKDSLTSQVDISGTCNVISRDFSIELIEVPLLLAHAGTKLDPPYSTGTIRKTADQSGKIIIPVIEGEMDIGCLEIKDLPTNLPIGTEVKVTLEFKPDFTIDMSAFIPSLDKKANCIIKISKVKVLPLDEMRKELGNLKDLYHEKSSHIEDRMAKIEFCSKIDEKISQIEVCFKELRPEDSKIANLLVELRSLIRRAPVKAVGLDPNLREFKTKLTMARNLMQEKSKIDSSALDHQSELDAIAHEAENVYEKGDRYRWSVLNESVDTIIANLKTICASKSSQSDLPPPEIAAPMIKQLILDEIDNLADEAKRQGKLNAIGQELQSLKSQIQNIDVHRNPKRAWHEIINLYHTHFKVLQNRVGYVGSKKFREGILQ